MTTNLSIITSPIRSRLWLACLAVGPLAFSSEPEGYFDETRDTTTLFAFDEVAIPFTQNLKLEMRSPERHPGNPVVARGPDGAADSWAVQFYGSVLRNPDTGKYRLWYVAVSKEERLSQTTARSAPWRVAYAESDDGIAWTKPSLGLVEAGGTTDNNLVRIDPPIGILNLKVLDEPDDPNPERRYKMGAHVWFPKNDVRLGTLATFASADGLTWKLLSDARPVDAEMPESETLVPPLHLEPVGGLYQWDGLYYLSGQNAIPAARPYHGRVSRTFVSPDFVNWSQSSAIQMVRTPQHDLLGPGKSREGEQTHEGIAVWPRGDVLLGISGLWHGTAEWKDLTIDLGFVISNDGIQFREPMHGWTFLERGEDGAWDQGGLLQGQGFFNVGGETRIYYGAWDPRGWEGSPPRGGIGIVTLPRDRFGDLVVDESTRGEGNYQMRETVSDFMTRALRIEEGPRRFFVNADGLGDAASLKIELLDAKTVPLPAYSGENAAIDSAGGFQAPVSWGGKSELGDLPERVRVKVTFQGEKKTGIRFSALYVR